MVLLLALCVVLAALGYWQWQQPPEETTVVISRTLASRGGLESGAVQLPGASLQIKAAAERPLFSPNRRPSSVAGTSDGPANVPPPALSLAGVVISGGERFALVQAGNPPRLVRLAVGEQILGWTVHAIAADRIVLRVGERSVDVVFQDRLPEPPGGQRPTAPRAPAPAASQPRP